MKHIHDLGGTVRHLVGGIMLSVFLVSRATAVAEDIHLGVLKTKTTSFTNVTVLTRSSGEIFVSHSQGLCNIKIKDLDEEALVALGLANPAAPAKPRASAEAAVQKSAELLRSVSTASLPDLKARVQQFTPGSMAAFSPGLSIRPSINFLVVFAAVFLGFYLFFCYCLKLICEKAGYAPGLLVWLPVVQLLPMMRAARMSGWWVLAFAVPLLNLVAQIVWAFKIVQARGKSPWIALLLLLPPTSFFAFLYLAFSAAGASSQSAEEAPLSFNPPVLGEA